MTSSTMKTSIGPKGLGGWLILLILGLARAAFTYIKTITEDVGLLEGLPQDKVAGVYAEILLTAAMLALLAWVMFEMFMKRRSFPRSWKMMAVASVLYGPVDAAMVSMMLKVPFDKVMDEQAIGQYFVVVVSIGLWWWYINVSIRVKNTFVN